MPEPNPVARRRTFAIISHPDAGKTTLTEKILLFGGAIQLAGEVRAKANRRQTRSDWMGIERERGISVVTSVMTFEYAGCVFNLLDTPGHEDFSEDTYRTLTAVDSAVMVIDAAKGIEARTRKLFEVCRLRDIPIVTFINKMDRETRDPFDLLDEIEKTLALDTAPLNWTIGRGRSLAGAYDIRNSLLTPLGKDAATIRVNGPDDPKVAELLPEHERAAAIEELTLAVEGLKPFDRQAFLEGHLTPVLFGSALKDFGVQRPDRRDGRICAGRRAPRPPRAAPSRRTKPKMTGFVFKIQANMDPNHRDRIAFMRVCSGRLMRGMRAKLVRTGKSMTLSAPQFFFAQDRSLAEEAYAGDVVGIPNHGLLRIGDTLTEGEDIVFRGVPSFAPEILRRVKLADAMKAKKLREALQQMAEEGVVQVFLPHDGAGAIVGVVGALQLDVLAERLDAEYGLPVSFEQSRFEVCRWVVGRRSRRTRQVPAGLSVLDRRRSRRRPGVHGVQRLQPALRAGALAEDRLRRREGLSEGGRLSLAMTGPDHACRFGKKIRFVIALQSGVIEPRHDDLLTLGVEAHQRELRLRSPVRVGLFPIGLVLEHRQHAHDAVVRVGQRPGLERLERMGGNQHRHHLAPEIGGDRAAINRHLAAQEPDLLDRGGGHRHEAPAGVAGQHDLFDAVVGIDIPGQEIEPVPERFDVGRDGWVAAIPAEPQINPELGRRRRLGINGKPGLAPGDLCGRHRTNLG